MLSKNQISHIVSLQSNKGRRKERQFLVEGPKLVGELLRSAWPPAAIFALAEWQDEGRILAQRKGIQVQEINESELKKISALVTPNLVMAISGIIPQSFDWSTFNKGLTLMLDDIHDPGNLGTILRIADWFGISQVICSNSCVDPFNPKVVQSSMGSIFRVKVFYQDLKNFLEDIPEGFPVMGAFLEGENICKHPLPQNGIIIIGSESHGISPELFPLITDKIFIPTYQFAGESVGGAESLNASVAAAIILHEFRSRQFRSDFQSSSGHHC